MTISRISLALSISAAAAFLAACGGSQPPIGAPPTSAQPSRSDGMTHHASATPSYQVLYRFKRSHGANPWAGLIDVNGTLYGTTQEGGEYGDGTVYGISLAGREKVVHSFLYYSDGAFPHSGLLNVNGTLYGTTSSGGVSGCASRYGCGAVYSVSPSGSEKVLHYFTGGSDGADPEAGLIDVNGTLYGSTSQGGGSGCNSGCGTVFTITTSGTEKVLYAFGGSSDGANPKAALIDVKGTLYGTTYAGGGSGCNSGCGTVFTVSTSGTEKVLHAFAGSDGSAPVAGLLDVRGILYGTTWSGGKHDGGAVYSITTGGVLRVLHSFGGRNDGSVPYARLISVTGTLYGTTDSGSGRDQNGTVYDITTTGSEKVVHRFSGGYDGSRPLGSLIDVKGKLYGTTYEGGVGPCFSNGCGTVFALTP